jgi:hypothetical protein
MSAHPHIQLLLPLVEFPRDLEASIHDAFFESPRRAAKACQRVLRRFPQLCKFLIRVCEEFGQHTLETLWYRIWGTLKKEREAGSNRVASILANLIDPDDRGVTFRSADGDEQVVSCVEALEELALA